MLEYDQNLPQEFAHEQKKRTGGGLQWIALALAAALLIYALIIFLPIISHLQI
jgi:hypothetical protein